MKLIIAKKPSVAKAINTHMRATEKKKSYKECCGYYVSWCYGHLAELYSPNDYSGN
ncbi:MAG: hypothetical protein LIO74_01290 [Ruminococcus sp.]|nr:hypothetical protein [Ruminococcus sp.]